MPVPYDVGGSGETGGGGVLCPPAQVGGSGKGAGLRGGSATADGSRAYEMLNRAACCASEERERVELCKREGERLRREGGRGGEIEGERETK